MPLFLVTSDLHLTDRPRDKYRWRIFPWLVCQAENRRADAVIIAGDLTHNKDRHAATFAHDLVAELRHLGDVCPVHLLKGNHDYVDPAAPFFGLIDGVGGLHYYRDPELVDIAGVPVFMLPHGGSLKESRPGMKKARLVIFHEPLIGARASHGHVIEEGRRAKSLVQGLEADVIGGDIHVPQRVGRALYCGAPHPIDFGDDFQPRVLMWNDGTIKSIKRTTLRKVHARIRAAGELDDLGMTKGDQLKVTLLLDREEFVDWQGRREEVEALAKKRGWCLWGVSLAERPPDRVKLVDEPLGDSGASPAQALSLYGKAKKLDPVLLEAGQTLVKGVLR